MNYLNERNLETLLTTKVKSEPEITVLDALDKLCAVYDEVEEAFRKRLKSVGDCCRIAIMSAEDVLRVQLDKSGRDALGEVRHDAFKRFCKEQKLLSWQYDYNLAQIMTQVYEALPDFDETGKKVVLETERMMLAAIWNITGRFSDRLTDVQLPLVEAIETIWNGYEQHTAHALKPEASMTFLTRYHRAFVQMQEEVEAARREFCNKLVQLDKDALYAELCQSNAAPVEFARMLMEFDIRLHTATDSFLDLLRTYEAEAHKA